MARKPSDIVVPSLRIREELRRRLEQAAKKRGVSLNFEMTSRLEDSFDQEKLLSLDEVTGNAVVQNAKLDAMLMPLMRQGDLIRAAKALIKAVEQSGDVQQALDKTKEAIAVIEREAARLPERIHST